jgi:hypothetical protein
VPAEKACDVALRSAPNTIISPESTTSVHFPSELNHASACVGHEGACAAWHKSCKT